MGKFFLSRGLLSLYFIVLLLSLPSMLLLLDESSDHSHSGGALLYRKFSAWKVESRVNSHGMGSLSEFCSKGWIRIASLNRGCLIKF